MRAESTGLLDEHALIGNPLDYGNALWGQEEPLRRVFAAALQDPEDVAALIIDYRCQAWGTSGTSTLRFARCVRRRANGVCRLQ